MRPEFILSVALLAGLPSPARADKPAATPQPLNTPYGRTEVVVEAGKLEHRIKVGASLYRVSEYANGFKFTDENGKTQRDAVRDGTTIITTDGPAPRLHTADGDKNVRMYNFSGVPHFYEFTAERGRINSSLIQPLQTPYGIATLVQKAGRLDQVLEVNGKKFTVESKPDGFAYVDAKGRRHNGGIRVGNAILTPLGKTRSVQTSQGRSDVLVTEGPPGIKQYQEVSIEGGALRYKPINPINTGWGQTKPELYKGRLRQRVTIEGRRFDISKKEYGIPRFTDAAGVTHVGAPRINGNLVTAIGRARWVQTAEGPRELVGTPTTYQFVSMKDGSIRYDWLSQKYTPYGPMRAVVTKKRVDFFVEIDGKDYRVERREGKEVYLDDKGQPYHDTWGERVRRSKPARNTVRRLADGTLPPLPDGPIVQIDGTDHMPKATYDQLRDAMIETMKKYPPDQHYFIGLGSDPHPIIAFLQNVGGRGLATNFPASGKYTINLDPRVLAPYVRKLIPPEVLNGSKTLVLLDQTDSGAAREGTLAQISRVFEAYLKSIGSTARVTKLAYSPSPQPSDTGQIDTNRYPEISRFLKPPYEHVVSQYDRHVLARNTLKDLIERPQYEVFKDAMLERMKRDQTLDTFLAQYAAK
jgi:hypothetical protein